MDFKTFPIFESCTDIPIYATEDFRNLPKPRSVSSEMSIKPFYFEKRKKFRNPRFEIKLGYKIYARCSIHHWYKVRHSSLDFYRDGILNRNY